jgi:hypothetical protein
MLRGRLLHRAIASACLATLVWVVGAAGTGRQGVAPYRIEPRAGRRGTLSETFTDGQLALLEKLNRADVGHLGALPQLVVPVSWTADELAYSPLPIRYAERADWPTYLVVHLPGQVFGAYEFGALVRWGPVSSGVRRHQTPAGLFALNWRSAGRASTINPDWFMRWYFNFGNHEGLAFHAYTLPGYPASRGCIRLLTRDAQWLYEWGQTWTLDSTGTRVLQSGTPVFVIGSYDFDAAPPWRSLTWLDGAVELPAPPDRVPPAVSP